MPLKIGEVARRVGVSIETIRYYERLGVLEEPPRNRSGYRQFGPEVLRRLHFVHSAQRLGFSLQEIRELLEVRSSPAGTPAAVRERAETKLAAIEAKVAALEAMRAAIHQLLDSSGGAGSARECSFLDALDGGGTDGGEA